MALLHSTNAVKKVERLRRLLIVIIVTYSIGAEADQNGTNVTNLGVILDMNTRIGKEQKTAMDVAAENFNNSSMNHSIALVFRHSEDPLTAASVAQEMIKESKVKVIIGMQTWIEAALVADVGSQAQVPVISFASPAVTPPLAERHWPFFIRMGSNIPAQMKCIADIVSTYNWKRVIPIYEDDGYGGDPGMLTLLSEALQDVGSKIEHHLVLPKVSSLADPHLGELEEMLKLSGFQSRVFIVLQLSTPTATNLFKVAKKMGLVGRDSAWIVIESTITGLLDAQVNDDTDGTLGIKTYTINNVNFNLAFQAKYAEETSSEPGIYALRAYDMTNVIAQAIQMTSSDSAANLHVALNTVLRNYTGLSGEMRIRNGEVITVPIWRIINLVEGNIYKELDFWRPEIGFTKRLAQEASKNITEGIGEVVWPGSISQPDPKGWAMPTADNPMRIGFPNATFAAFASIGSDGKILPGFCIELFNMVLRGLNYSLPCEFHNVDKNAGTYDDAVEQVHNKTLDGMIGDVTITAERFNKVEYTQPYIESPLVLIVPGKAEDPKWILVKPFSGGMWAATGAIFAHTIFTIWFLERSVNPKFQVPLTNQIGISIWFAFNSLFFAHREKLYNKLTKVVVLVWLVVVLILVTSYTANLSSMLTVHRMNLNGLDIETLKSSNSKVGFNKHSFVKDYLVNNLGFKGENLIQIDGKLKYIEAFKNKSISAALLEFPYAKVFMNQYCKGYTSTPLSYKFGGLGFIFQKGSPIAGDFSKVILQLLESGTVMSLEDTWLTPNRGCQNNSNSEEPGSFKVDIFAGLYGTYVATSTMCLVLFLTMLLKQFQQHEQNAYQADESVWNRALRMVRFVCNGEFSVPPATSSASFVDELELTSPQWEHPIGYTPQEHLLQASTNSQTNSPRE